MNRWIEDMVFSFLIATIVLIGLCVVWAIWSMIGVFIAVVGAVALSTAFYLLRWVRNRAT